MNKILEEDLQLIINSGDYFKKLNNKTILITGFKGMIGSYLTKTCLYLNDIKGFNINVIGLTKRNENIDPYISNHPNMNIVIQDVSKPFEIENHVDWVIHAASPASPKIMKIDPVGTIAANALGTWNALDFAYKNNSEGFLFISSREIYGQPYDNQEQFYEDTYGLVDPLRVRSCYPEGKKCAETMCVCYKEQYGLNTKIARLAHTYGPGMSINDGRVQADFLNNVLNKENIVMKSTGEAIRTYTYIADAVSALFRILLDSNDIVYNIGDSKNKVSIKELAEILVQINPEDHLKVVMDIPKDALKGVSPFTLGILNNEKLLKLGWEPQFSIFDGFKRTVRYLEIERAEGRI
ncbi:MAG: NAD-dependent epimerase/dehydratase family protein [Erysipelotrichaceae bacterium]|nr:NAD-dependent epimerase/dehydratase family protein [Erysipelotrichaceae bacterium]